LINQAWKSQLSSICFFQHHLQSCSFPEENVFRTRSRRDTCRRAAGTIGHVISNGPYLVLAQCCVSSWSVDKKSVLQWWRRRANTFLIMFYVQSIVIIINTLLETY